MSGGESESWGMAESHGNIKEFLGTIVILFLFFAASAYKDQRETHKDQEDPPILSILNLQQLFRP